MNEIVRRLISKVVEKFAGSGVEIDGLTGWAEEHVAAW